MYSKFTEYFQCTRKTKPQLIIPPRTVFLIHFLETENYEFDIPVLLLVHTLCHILFLPHKTHADFAEGLIFSKPRPSVEMHTFSTESVLCQWSRSKASPSQRHETFSTSDDWRMRRRSEIFVLP